MSSPEHMLVISLPYHCPYAPASSKTGFPQRGIISKCPKCNSVPLENSTW